MQLWYTLQHRAVDTAAIHFPSYHDVYSVWCRLCIVLLAHHYSLFAAWCRLCIVQVAVKLFNPGAVVLRVDIDTRVSHNRFALIMVFIARQHTAADARY